MPEHENVYQNETEKYHALVSFEDYQKNLTRSICEILTESQKILETGAGTGRVTKILAPLSRELVSFDLSIPMLSLASSISSPDLPDFRGYAAADHRYLPAGNCQFDWVVSGWSVCYLVSWQSQNWKQEVGNALKEFTRILNSDGHILIIETLGTGKFSPEPPPHLIEYLQFLEKVGFHRQWLRTDYQFPDIVTARELTEFFFGSDMLNYIDSQTLPILPECTGLWIGDKQDVMKMLSG